MDRSGNSPFHFPVFSSGPSSFSRFPCVFISVFPVSGFPYRRPSVFSKLADSAKQLIPFQGDIPVRLRHRLFRVLRSVKDLQRGDYKGGNRQLVRTLSRRESHMQSSRNTREEQQNTTIWLAACKWVAGKIYVHACKICESEEGKFSGSEGKWQIVQVNRVEFGGV